MISDLCLQINFTTIPPEGCVDGFLRAEIELGDLKESVLCETGEWNEIEYIKHWERSRERLLKEKVLTLFCSSLGGVNADIWAADPFDNKVTVYNLQIMRADIVVDGCYINARGIEEVIPELRNSDASKWPVGHVSR